MVGGEDKSLPGAPCCKEGENRRVKNGPEYPLQVDELPRVFEGLFPRGLDELIGEIVSAARSRQTFVAGSFCKMMSRARRGISLKPPKEAIQR